MHEGARAAYKDLKSQYDNEAYKYAVVRYKLHTQTKKTVEIFASFYDELQGFGRWRQALFGESEGKEGKGLLPVNLTYSRDLHSMGQYVQHGNPIFFETILNIQNPPVESKLNTAAFKGVVKAHSDAGVPVVVINIDRLDAYGFGYLFYFFEIACAMSAFLLGVNPFDQPGVEFYKKEMLEHPDIADYVKNLPMGELI
jgi:glucose-6-phosphate isomerase